MGDSIISWTDKTFNPAWGCVKISPGCAHCYADTLSQQYGWKEDGAHKAKLWGPNSVRRTFGPKYWKQPYEWNQEALASPGIRGEGFPLMVFCASMCDIFEDHPTITNERAKLWNVIRLTPHLDWQLLTKRPERIAANLPGDWGGGWQNVWIGTSIENNNYVRRANAIRDVPAIQRFISYEPALGKLDNINLEGIAWVIYGAESGSKFRVHDLEWPRYMRDRCKSEGVAFFFKQVNASRPQQGAILDGETIKQFPFTQRRL